MLPLATSERIILDGGELLFWPELFSTAEADELFALIKQETPWVQSDIFIAGRKIPIPRLNAWYGESGAHYSYSGVKLETLPFTPALGNVKARVEEQTGHNFNSALVNLYRDERDSVDWHADDEPELGANPVVASVSLGESRCFELRRNDNHRNKLKIVLPGGSLLLMAGPLQHQWQHRVAKEKSRHGERVNITFRTVHNRRH